MDERRLADDLICQKLHSLDLRRSDNACDEAEFSIMGAEVFDRLQSGSNLHCDAHARMGMRLAYVITNTKRRFIDDRLRVDFF